MGDFMQGFAEGAVGFGIPYFFKRRNEEEAQARQDKRDAQQQKHWEANYALQLQQAKQNTAINKERLKEAQIRRQGLEFKQKHQLFADELTRSWDPVEWGKINSLDVMNADHQNWEYLGVDEKGRPSYKLTDKSTGDSHVIYYDNMDALKNAMLHWADPAWWSQTQKVKAQLQLEAAKQKNRVENETTRFHHQEKLVTENKKAQIDVAKTKQAEKTAASERSTRIGNYLVTKQQLDTILSLYKNQKPDPDGKYKPFEFFAQKVAGSSQIPDKDKSAHKNTLTSEQQKNKAAFDALPDGARFWQGGIWYEKRGGNAVPVQGL